MGQLSYVKMNIIFLNEFHVHSQKLQKTQDQSASVLSIIFHLTREEKDEREPKDKWEPMCKKEFSVQGIKDRKKMQA